MAKNAFWYGRFNDRANIVSENTSSAYDRTDVMKETTNRKLFNQKIMGQLKQFIAYRVFDKNEAEEIFQDTLISACEALLNFWGRSSFFSWLCGIAKHEISDFYRKKKIKTILFSRLPFLEKLADQALGPEEEAIEGELKRQVKRVLRNMSEGYRQVLRLKYMDGLSVGQIADRLGLTLKATESRLSRARLSFREAWAQDDQRRPRKIKKGSFF